MNRSDVDVGQLPTAEMRCTAPIYGAHRKNVSRDRGFRNTGHVWAAQLRGGSTRLAVLATIVVVPLLMGAAQRGQHDGRAIVASDSTKLENSLRDEEYAFVQRWRRSWEQWVVDYLNGGGSIVRPAIANDDTLGWQRPRTYCSPALNVEGDFDAPNGMSAFVASPVRKPTMSLCPMWASRFVEIPGSEEEGIDGSIGRPERDTVRQLRKSLIVRFDSASARLPGDRWIAGQRVRLNVDQGNFLDGGLAASDCRADAWWCDLLRGYVLYAARNMDAAESAFDEALSAMPADTQCVWNNPSSLLPYTGRKAYEAMPCAQRLNVNANLWWLADPLLAVRGNERYVEHFGRLMRATLDEGNIIDLHEDVRDDYAGPAYLEMVERYGWPETTPWQPPAFCLRAQPPRCTYRMPQGPSRFDTKDAYLGLTQPPMIPPLPPARRAAPGRATAPRMQTTRGTPAPQRPRAMYVGPQYHTLSTWSAILDPLHASADDWQLGPDRETAASWDPYWFPTEFYDRPEGPLVDLDDQVAFLRRGSSAVIAAATSWTFPPSIVPPPSDGIFALTTMGGPSEPPRTIGTAFGGSAPRALLTPVDSRPLLLGLEWISRSGKGAAGRVRFGVTPPPPLRLLRKDSIALSDPIFTQKDTSGLAPQTVQQTLTLMFGSTTLHAPHSIGIFWEVYGQHDHDTVDVTLDVVRENDAALGKRLASVVGLAHAGTDSIGLNWREPRPGDPLATIDSGVSIRPRSVVLDVSTLPDGAYVLEVHVRRPNAAAGTVAAAEAVSRRAFRIVR